MLTSQTATAACLISSDPELDLECEAECMPWSVLVPESLLRSVMLELLRDRSLSTEAGESATPTLVPPSAPPSTTSSPPRPGPVDMITLFSVLLVSTKGYLKC